MATARSLVEARSAGTKAAQLAAIYNDKHDGYGSIAETYAKAKKVNPSITYEDARRFINKKEYQLTRHVEKKHNSFISMGPRFEIELDIMDFGAEITPEDGYRYGVVGIDNFTKRGEVVLTESRDTKSLRESVLLLMEKLGIPKQIYTDGEGYFKSTDFSIICDRRDIKHIMTAGKANAVERFIRTIKENIFKRLENRPAKDWEKVVGNVVGKYNRTQHTTTGLTPHEATDPRNEMFVRYNLFDKAKTARKWPPTQEGEMVRVRLVRKTGVKGYDPKYSTTKYKVWKIQNGTYTIKLPRKPTPEEAQMRKTYQRFELLKV